MSLEDSSELEAIPIYGSSSSSSAVIAGGGGSGGGNASYDQDTWGNASNSDGGVDFGVTIINPNLGNGSTTTTSTTIFTYTPESYSEERNWVVVGVLVALIVMLWIILGGMLCYPLLRYIKRRWPVSERRINRRYDTIEGWLITKVVRAHDEGCEQIQRNCYGSKGAEGEEQQRTTSTGEVSDTGSDAVYEGDEENQDEIIKHRESYDTMETAFDESFVDDDDLGLDDDFGGHANNNLECPICMERFAVGDIVSWSSYERCSHVYHHQCIKEWLVSHNTCPFCREVFLPVDKAHVKRITKEIFEELSEIRARRAEKTYFCVQDGLVTLEGNQQQHQCKPPFDDDTTMSSPSLLRTTSKCGHIINRHDIKEKLKPGVTKADLRKLRGDRAEKICYGDTGGRLTIIENHHHHHEFDDEDIESQQQQHPCPPSDLVEPTIVRNDSLTSQSSDEDDADDDNRDENNNNPNEQRHNNNKEVSSQKKSDTGFADLSCREEEGLEAGLNGIIGESSTASSQSKPTAAAATAQPTVAVISEEARADIILETVEAGGLTLNQTATAAIELELTEASKRGETSAKISPNATNGGDVSPEQATKRGPTKPATSSKRSTTRARKKKSSPVVS